MAEKPEMDDNGFYPDWATACPECGSESTDEVVTYPESQGLWSDGGGGVVDCKCEQCGYEWMRDFGENDIPDMSPI